MDFRSPSGELSQWPDCKCSEFKEEASRGGHERCQASGSMLWDSWKTSWVIQEWKHMSSSGKWTNNRWFSRTEEPESLGDQGLGDCNGLVQSFAVVFRTIFLGWDWGGSWGACGGKTEDKECIPIINLECLVKDTKFKFLEEIHLFSLPSKSLRLLAGSWLHPLRKRVWRSCQWRSRLSLASGPG